MDGALVYCNDVCGLMEELQLQYVPEQWRLFIDSSMLSIKAVLKHNGNKHPSIPLAHAVHMKQSYASIQGLLKKACYVGHQGNICADRKDVAILTGLQGYYTKFCCSA